MTEAIIFDFDDTLVATNRIYDEARREFFAEMTAFGKFDEDEMAYYLNAADIANVEAAGHLAKECFPLAMRQTYEHFLKAAGKDCREGAAQKMEDIGWRVFDKEPSWLPGAKELLAELQGKVKLFLFSQGNIAIQETRIRKSGVLAYFDDYRIVEQKDAGSLSGLIKDKGIDVSASWMVGNSVRSDINPALENGLNAALYVGDVWDYELAEPVGAYHRLDELKDILELI